MQPAVESLKGYITIKDAAEMLGVSPETLRNWDRSGKLTAIRHPINGYRLYRREELDAFLRGLRRLGNASAGDGEAGHL